MTEVTSVSAIVSQITATLSESVSELTLLVVQKKEENAEVSPELPTAVQAVCRAADTLVQVADQLADAEYVEYTAIFNEMKEATAQVSSASSRLFASVQTLNSSTSSNRQDGWQSLSDSCGLIAKKTIRLLEIVYGAEIKRTLTVAANAVRALRDLSDRMEEVEADPQAFADAAGEAAGQVNQVAAYLEEVYQSVATSPEERQRLQALADKLKDQSQAIIDDANKVLEDPSSSSAFADMTRTIESTKTLIDEATRPLQKELNPDSKATAAIVDQLEQQLSALPVLAQNVASSSNAKENDSEGKRTRKEWQNELDRIDDLLRELETANGGNVMAKVGGAEGKEEQEEREKEEMCQRAKAVLVKMRPGIVVNKRDAKSSLSSSKDLLVAAQELADLMAGLIAKNKASAVTGFNKRSDAALELAELLDELDRLSQSNKGKEISVARVNSLLDAVHKVDDVVQGKTNKHKPSSASSVSATSSSTSSRSSAPSSSTAPASSAPAAATSAPRSAAPRSSAPSAASSSAAPTAAAAVESNNQLVGEIERMAQDLKAQTSNTKMAANDSQDPFVQSYTSISEQLSALARAAKQGKGNELLTTARAIAASLNQLIQAINALAARCTHIPSERERLLKYSAALSNFGVQLKILASVKAASAQPDMDNDSSLVNLTNNIGKALSAALSTLDSVKLRVK
ncbi:Ras GTPase [Balamuthia mandrillaris]